MRYIYFFALFFLNTGFSIRKAHISEPQGYIKLKNAYPDFIDHYADNKVYFKDGSYLIYNDEANSGKTKSPADLLNTPDLEDQFLFKYAKGNYDPKNNNDAGRIRNEAFFKKMYGSTQAEVSKKVVEITWCPKNIKQKIKVTTANGVDKKFQAISSAVDKLIDLKPDYKKYVTEIGGTFVWRKISGTNRLSMHSFGMTIDINTKYSSYWQWSCGCKNEEAKIGSYKNEIPQEIIDIFENNGFVWGGKWTHFDSMHFEYRPELLP